ncbi:MAG: aldo/keto reductase [Gammaproteobacteria bacterium]|nr:aldo/keto reductase [Gammaproteobacteria bacterium]
MTTLRPLGPSGMQIPPLVFGTMARREAAAGARETLVRAAVERGLTALDTAPLYDFGGCERLIGRALQGLPREHYQLLTKVGLRWDAGAHGQVLFSFDDPQGQRVHVRRNSRPESIRAEVEASLRRLRVEYLDLVQVHHPDVDTPFAESFGELVRLRAEGKLLHIGASNFSVSQLAAAQVALGEVPLCSLQPEYSLLRREVEQVLLPYCRQHGLGVLAYSPLAGGALGGRVPPIADRAAMQRLHAALTEVLQPVADAHGVAPVAVALAWVAAQPGVTAAIAGASDLAQLDTQLPALELKLTPEETARLSQGFAAVDWPSSWTLHEGRLRRGLRRIRRVLGRGLRATGLRRR